MMAELNTMYPGKNIAVANFRNVWFPTKSPNDPVYGNNSAAVRYHIEPLLKTTSDSYIFPHCVRSKVRFIATLNELIKISTNQNIKSSINEFSLIDIFH